jgi:hypothetical protein
MPFRDFFYPQVLGRLGLTIREADLSGGATLLPVRPEFAAFLQEALAIATGDLGVCTEKAKSEFIVAPLLVELRRLMGRRFSVFSGMELNVHKGRALNGECDYILTKGDNQQLRQAPIVGVLEAKNEDHSQQGLGQCIAALYAAHLRNQKDQRSVCRVFGAVTTGRAWQLLQLEEGVLTLDRTPYGIRDLGRLLGILAHQIECALDSGPAAARRPAGRSDPVLSAPS